MTRGPGELTALSPEECWELLARLELCRVAWCDGGLPDLRPANYRVVGGHLLLHLAAGTWEDKVHDAVVVLEVDEVDPVSRSGRSVLVRGTGRVLRSGGAALRAATAVPASWLGGRALPVLVTPAEVSGRWLLPPGA